MPTPSRRDTIGDYVTLSFADVLTCVLGASIALFLIFIAIIKLTEADSAAAGLSLGSKPYLVQSIEAELNAGFATATLRMVAPGLSDLNVSAPNDETVERSELSVLHEGEEYLGIVDQYNEGINGFNVYTLESPFEATTVKLSLQVGGMSYGCDVKLNANHLPGTEVQLFVLGSNTPGFINSENEFLCEAESV